MDKDKVREVAKGRVWTGKQAINVDLIDEFGGMVKALEECRKASDAENSQHVCLFYSPQKLSMSVF